MDNLNNDWLKYREDFGSELVKTLPNKLFDPVSVKRGGNLSGNIGYLGANRDALTPKLIVNTPNVVNPLNSTSGQKFGFPTNRLSTSNDLSNTGIPSSHYVEIGDIIINIYNDPNFVDQPILNEMLDNIKSIMKEGVYI